MAENKTRKALRQYFTVHKNAFYSKTGSGRKWSEMTPTQRNYVLDAIAETTLSDEERNDPYISVNWHYSRAREKNRGESGYHYVKSVVIDIAGRGDKSGDANEREQYRTNSVTFTDKSSFQFLNALTRNLYQLKDLERRNLKTGEIYGVPKSVTRMMNEFTLINAVPTNFPSRRKAMDREHFTQQAKQHLLSTQKEMEYRIKSIHGFNEVLFKDYTNIDPTRYFALDKNGKPIINKNGTHRFKSVTDMRDYYALANDVIEQVVGFNDEDLDELFGSEVHDHFYAWLKVNHPKALKGFANVKDNTKAKWYLDYVKQMNEDLGQEYRPPRIRIINPDTAKGKAKAKKDKDANKRLKDLINERFGQ